MKVIWDPKLLYLSMVGGSFIWLRGWMPLMTRVSTPMFWDMAITVGVQKPEVGVDYNYDWWCVAYVHTFLICLDQRSYDLGQISRLNRKLGQRWTSFWILWPRMKVIEDLSTRSTEEVSAGTLVCLFSWPSFLKGYPQGCFHLKMFVWNFPQLSLFLSNIEWKLTTPIQADEAPNFFNFNLSLSWICWIINLRNLRDPKGKKFIRVKRLTTKKNEIF